MTTQGSRRRFYVPVSLGIAIVAGVLGCNRPSDDVRVVGPAQDGSSPGDANAGGATSGASTAPAAPTLRVEAALKQLRFSWDPVPGATRYELLENPDGVSGFAPIATGLTTTTYAQDVAVHLQNWEAARYRVRACNDGGCNESNDVGTAAQMAKAIGYVKASNTGLADRFGAAVAVSENGETVAVGAPGESSISNAINSGENDNTAPIAGAVYVLSRGSAGWAQQAYLKPSNNSEGSGFGGAVALSADGNTLAVGAPWKSNYTGAVYVFRRSGMDWSETAYLTAPHADAGDRFGDAIALSADGNTLAIGASAEASRTGMIGGDATDNSANGSGAVYVFVRDRNGWSSQAYIKAPNSAPGIYFGRAVALAGDGDTLAVGAPSEGWNATGVGVFPGNYAGLVATEAGAVYTFRRAGAFWSGQAYVKPLVTAAKLRFGEHLAMSRNGRTLVVSAYGDDRANPLYGSNDGTVYVFALGSQLWSQRSSLKRTAATIGRPFGSSLGVTDDGSVLAVGSGDGLVGPDRGPPSGQVDVFRWDGETWSSSAFPSGRVGDAFGNALAISGNGTTLVVGAKEDASKSVGIGGDPTDTSGLGCGSVFLY